MGRVRSLYTSGKSESPETLGRNQPVNAGFADFHVFEFAGRSHRICRALFRACSGKIASSRITKVDLATTEPEFVEPAKEAFGKRPLVAHVADKNRAPGS